MESVVNKQVEGQTVDCKLFRLYNIHSFFLQFKKIIFSTLLALRDKTEENGKQGKREKKRKERQQGPEYILQNVTSLGCLSSPTALSRTEQQ